MAILSKKSKTEEVKNAGEEKTSSEASPVVFGTVAQRVLLNTRLSEKASKLSRINKYVFNVTPKANKVEVKKAIEDAYKVRVTQVNIVTNKGKTRNFGATRGRTSGFKKAVVTLKAGDVIKGIE